MFDKFEDMCDYYVNCIDCPYEDCSSKEDCRREYNKDKVSTVTRLDMLVEVAEINSKLNKILNILINNKV